MKSGLRALRLMLAIGWETGPVTFLTFVAVSAAASAGPMLFAFGLKPLVDGIYYQHTGNVVTGAVTVVVSLLLIISAPAVVRWNTPRLRERSIMVMQRRLLALSTSSPGLDQFERPDFWDRLQMIKRNFGDLLIGMADALFAPVMLGQLLIATVVLASIQPLMLMLPALAVPAAWLNQKAKKLELAAENRAAAPRRAAQHLFTLASSAQSAKETRMYALDDALLNRHRDLDYNIRRLSEASLAKSFALSTAGWVVFVAGYAGAALLALATAAAGGITPGDVVLTLTLSTSLIAASSRLAMTAGLLIRAAAVARNYHWLASNVSAASRRVFGRSQTAVPAFVQRGFELKNVSFGYPGSGRPVLAGADLRLDAGSVVAVVGENGAGKTTLVKLLCRMYTPDAGQILLDGTDIQEMDLEDYRSAISAGFQDFVRFELLARETVGVGHLPQIGDGEAILSALGRAEAQFAERLHQGIETQLGRAWVDGVDLSGGEWQKLALARAMMRQNAFLTVFDEPTAALDPGTEQALFERIADASRRGTSHGRITMLVSHRFSTVRMADTIVVLGEGRILEHGSHRTLVANHGLYAELYELQARAYRI